MGEIDDSYNVSYTYGARGGSNPYRFKPDDKLRRFNLSGVIPDEVTLTYISTGIDNAATNYIPVYMEDVLEKFLDWQLAMNDPMTHLGDKDMKRRDYYDALREVKKFKAPPLNDVLDAIRGSVSQSIRR
jgi:hypothetical protein